MRPASGWRGLVGGIAGAAWCAGSFAQAAPYTIDPTHTFASVEVDTGLTTLRLRFDRKSGTIEFDRAGRRGAVQMAVDMGSLSSGLPALDERLRSAALFDVARFPQATFASETFTFDGDRVVEVAGMLTLHGQVQPVSLKALRFGCYVNPLFLREVCGGDFEAWLEPGRWGLPQGGDSPLAGAGPRVRLLVQVEAIRQ